MRVAVLGDLHGNAAALEAVLAAARAKSVERFSLWLQPRFNTRM